MTVSTPTSPDLLRLGKQRHWKRNLALAAAAASLSSLIFAGFYYYDQSRPVNTANSPMTIGNLISAYMDDPSRADSLYAGRVYYVTGVPLSVQLDSTSGRYYSDFVFSGFVQFYWRDSSQAGQVTPCIREICQPIVAKCLLTGFFVKSGDNEVIMLTNCEFIR